MAAVAKNVSEKKSESVRRALNAAVPRSLSTEAPRTLYKVMNDYLLEDDRTFLPSVLCIAACEIVGGAKNSAMPAACAIGMIETMRVIYEELNCLKENTDTHGSYVPYLEGMAILAGDSLLALAFQHITKGMDKPTAMEVERERIVMSICELGKAAGALITSGGLAIDQIYECSAVVGAIVGGGSEYQIQRMREYGRCIGHAVVDMKNAKDEVTKLRFDGKREVPCFAGEKVAKLFALTDSIAFAST